MGYKNSVDLQNITEQFSDHFINISAGVFQNTLLKNSKLYRKKGNWNKRFKQRHFLADAYIAYGKGINKTIQNNTFLSLDTIIKSSKLNTKIIFDKFYFQAGAHFHGNIFGFSLTGMIGMLQFNKIGIYGKLNVAGIENLFQTLQEKRHYLTSGYTMKASLSFYRFKLVYCLHQDNILGLHNLNDYLVGKVRQVKIQVNMYNLFQKT